MVEGPDLLAKLCAAFDFGVQPDRVPVPVAHLTVRARDGIYLQVRPRQACASAAVKSP